MGAVAMMSVYGFNASGCDSHDSTGWHLLAELPVPTFCVSYFCDMMALHIRIQFLEQIARVFRAVVSQMLFVQEEVDAEVCFADDSGILNRKVADTRKHEVL
jgi:hypothetical protein